jgi:hypothetical protein
MLINTCVAVFGLRSGGLKPYHLKIAHEYPKPEPSGRHSIVDGLYAWADERLGLTDVNAMARHKQVHNISIHSGVNGLAYRFLSNRRRFKTRCCEVPGADVDNVRCVPLSPEIWMPKRRCSFIGPVRHGDSLGNLRSAEDHVNEPGDEPAGIWF